MLSKSLRKNVTNNTKRYEGSIPYMYLDTGGLVTVGVGFYLATPEAATKYKFNTSDGMPASSTQIETEYSSVAAMEPGMLASYYKRDNGLTMPEEQIDTELNRKIDVFGAELAGLYSDFDCFPEPAQQALFDLVFNLGITNLRTSWPSMNAAIDAKNWIEAAAQSHRAAPVSDARNQYVYDLFVEAVS